MKISKHIAVVIIIMIVFIASSCVQDKELKYEMNDLSEAIISQLTNDDIKVAGSEYSNTGVYITLYGSDDTADIQELIEICDSWVDSHQDSRLVSERLKISVVLYKEKPSKRKSGVEDYVVSIRNYSDNVSSIEQSDKLDCIKINVQHSIASSIFESTSMDYRVIILPSTVEFDDFDVFIQMEDLEHLIISDSPFDTDRSQVEQKYAELISIAEGYDQVDFACEMF
ncbi:hypothetical protein SAMN06296952_0875 [Oscillospiraceae bacterium]|nr:hypothetical protein SAMN06296952_0875 [Oscillospiraceae bacterium]